MVAGSPGGARAGRGWRENTGMVGGSPGGGRAGRGSRKNTGMVDPEPFPSLDTVSLFKKAKGKL
jgi:hypothetical protein